MNDRQKVLRDILPASLVPSATGTGFLVIGSRGSKCFFPLDTYLVVAGSISLSIPILAAVFRFIYHKIYADDVVDPFEAILLKVMQHLSKAVVLIEVLILLAGIIIIGPNLSSWQYNDINDTTTYCDGSLVWFSLAFLIGTWVFIFAGAVVYFSLSYAIGRSEQ